MAKKSEIIEQHNPYWIEICKACHGSGHVATRVFEQKTSIEQCQKCNGEGQFYHCRCVGCGKKLEMANDPKNPKMVLCRDCESNKGKKKEEPRD
jgi:RecJ-like exonuclease